MEYIKIQEYRNRLMAVVELAYNLLCQKIAAESISIFNEASLQLHLGTILKSLGQLYEFSSEDRATIISEYLQDTKADVLKEWLKMEYDSTKKHRRNDAFLTYRLNDYSTNSVRCLLDLIASFRSFT